MTIVGSPSQNQDVKLTDARVLAARPPCIRSAAACSSVLCRTAATAYARRSHEGAATGWTLTTRRSLLVFLLDLGCNGCSWPSGPAQDHTVLQESQGRQISIAGIRQFCQDSDFWTKVYNCHCAMDTGQVSLNYMASAVYRC